MKESVCLDMRQFGERLLDLIPDGRRNKLEAIASVILFTADQMGFDQSDIDDITDEAIHACVGIARRSERIDNWREQRRLAAKIVSDRVDLLVSSIEEPSDLVDDEPYEMSSVAVEAFKHVVGQKVAEFILAGYSIKDACRLAGISRSQYYRNLEERTR